MSSSECSSGSASCSSGSESTCGSASCSSGSESTCGSASCSSGSECTCGKKGAKTGQKWENRVHFVYEPVYWNSPSGFHRCEFEDHSLQKDMELFAEAGGSEKILEIWVYKCKLRNMWQLTDFFFNHQFVVIKSTNFWWSIEKDDKRIAINRSTFERNVRDFVDTIDKHGDHFLMARRLPVTQLSYDECKPDKTMADVVNFLYYGNELLKAYDVAKDNCKDFAERIFNEFAEGKKHGKVVGSDCAVS